MTGGRDPGQVLLLGHRGAVAASFVENTLSSVDRALRSGADGVEIDVRLTADCVPVCLHDPTLGRTTGDARPLGDVLAADLPAGVARLDDMLELVGDRGRLIVELKKPDAGVVGTVEAVAAVLRRSQVPDLVISSFDRSLLGALRLLLDEGDVPRTLTALLGRPGLPLGLLLKRAFADGHDQVHPHVLSLLTRLDLVRTAAQQGITVTGWTVNRASDLVRLAEAGVEAAITDDASAAFQVLAQEGLARAI
jgi:glycerophosphoryl diester phosphodiesterase